MPLIVHWPGSKVRNVGAIVQSIDLAPTVLELAGLERPPAMQGESLVPLLEGKVKTHREEAYVNQGAWQAKRSIITDRWKYTRSQAYEMGVGTGEDREENFDQWARSMGW